MPQSNEPVQLLTAPALQAMTATDRAAYFATLAPDEAANEQMAYSGFIKSQNAKFMSMSLRKTASMVPLGGGTTAPFQNGQAITFDFPTAGGAWASAIVVVAQLTINCAAGTAATYAINGDAPLNLIDHLVVNFNGTQHNFRPFVLKYLGLLRGYGRSAEPQSVLAGFQDATIQSAINSGFAVATGNNTWNFYFRFPLNAINPNNPAGLLPMQTKGTTPQLVINCSNQIMGNDPVLNAVRASGGTGNAVTVTGTFQCLVEYLDGTNLWSPKPLTLDMSGEPTVQFIEDQPISNLVAGSVNRGRIASLLQHYVVLDTILDGVAPGVYSTINNIQLASMDMDSVGYNSFARYGIVAGNNVPLIAFYERFRQKYGQDITEGVIPWVCGWSGNVNSDNRDGIGVLNMGESGWGDVNTAYQFAAVGANASPRVIRHLVSINPAGLKLVNS